MPAVGSGCFRPIAVSAQRCDFASVRGRPWNSRRSNQIEVRVSVALAMTVERREEFGQLRSV